MDYGTIENKVSRRNWPLRAYFHTKKTLELNDTLCASPNRSQISTKFDEDISIHNRDVAKNRKSRWRRPRSWILPKWNFGTAWWGYTSSADQQRIEANQAKNMFFTVPDERRLRHQRHNRQLTVTSHLSDCNFTSHSHFTTNFWTVTFTFLPREHMRGRSWES